MKEYMRKIHKFNYMYGLDVNSEPTNLGLERFRQLQDIMQEEFEEGEDIAKKFGRVEDDEILTEMADWLGDIMVYCSTFATSWGIPIDKVLEIIMESNFSKLDENNKILTDERGKVLKGKNYWKPEPQIKELLQKVDGKVRAFETKNESEDEVIVRRVS